MLGGPARAFMAGLLLLSGLILLAACANLGSLFARLAPATIAPEKSRYAWPSDRGAASSSGRLLTEAVVVSLAGGAVGLLGGIAILRWLTAVAAHPGHPHQYSRQS